jgi:uncharacterized protein with PIN domain
METGSAKGSVPEKVAASHQDFFQCIECSKVFWEGSHVNRIRALVKLVDSRLDNNVRD